MATRSTRDQQAKERIDGQYAELRANDPAELERCVQRASAIGMNHRLIRLLRPDEQLRLLADIEQSLVDCAVRNRQRQGGE